MSVLFRNAAAWSSQNSLLLTSITLGEQHRLCTASAQPWRLGLDRAIRAPQAQPQSRRKSVDRRRAVGAQGHRNRHKQSHLIDPWIRLVTEGKGA